MLLNTFNKVEASIEKKMKYEPLKSVKETLKVGREIEAQNVAVDAQGRPQLKKGVAKDRRIAVEDPEMRHGRKSKSQRVDGYKRHVLKDLDIGVVRAVGVTAANAPEASVTQALDIGLKAQKVEIAELHIDRAYLSSEWVTNRDENLKRCNCSQQKRGLVENEVTHKPQKLRWTVGIARLKEPATANIAA